jgi:hypothetical protein
MRSTKQASEHAQFIYIYININMLESFFCGAFTRGVKTLEKQTAPFHMATEPTHASLLRPTEFVSSGATSHPTSNALPLGFLPKQWPARRDESSRFATAIHEPHGHGLRSRAPRRRLPFSPGTPRHRSE